MKKPTVEFTRRRTLAKRKQSQFLKLIIFHIILCCMLPSIFKPSWILWLVLVYLCASVFYCLMKLVKNCFLTFQCLEYSGILNSSSKASYTGCQNCPRDTFSWKLFRNFLENTETRRIPQNWLQLSEPMDKGMRDRLISHESNYDEIEPWPWSRFAAIQVLKRLEYQTACAGDDVSNHDQKCTENDFFKRIFQRYGVNGYEFTSSVGRLRFWLASQLYYEYERYGRSVPCSSQSFFQICSCLKTINVNCYNKKNVVSSTQEKLTDVSMHLFSTYLERNLLSCTESSDVRIVQSEIGHYIVINRGEIFALPVCEENPLYAMLTFLLEIKMRKGGRLGTVDFGLNGLDLLWIVDSTRVPYCDNARHFN